MKNAIHSRVRRSQAMAPNSNSPGSQLVSGQPHHSRSNTMMAKNHNSSTRNTAKRRLCLFASLVLMIEFIFIHFSGFVNRDIDETMVAIPRSRTTLPPVQHPPLGNPDGTFGGYPVYHRTQSHDIATPYTLLNCVGHNWNEDSWKHRSCHFKFFCFNVTSRVFQIYQRRDDTFLQLSSQNIPLMDLSESLLSNTSLHLSLGGINTKWGQEGIQRLKWFPNVQTTPPTEFYALPGHVVLVPYHSLGGWNPGHAIWDDFLPLWTLADIFQMPQEHILAIRFVLEGEGLWASCDAPAKKEGCKRLQEKFWAMFNNQTFPTTQRDVRLKVDSPKTDLVCAKNGLAGISDLTDHGFNKLHGWHEEVCTFSSVVPWVGVGGTLVIRSTHLATHNTLGVYRIIRRPSTMDGAAAYGNFEISA
jgi:hypothetical protein